MREERDRVGGRRLMTTLIVWRSFNRRKCSSAERAEDNYQPGRRSPEHEKQEGENSQPEIRGEKIALVQTGV